MDIILAILAFVAALGIGGLGISAVGDIRDDMQDSGDVPHAGGILLGTFVRVGIILVIVVLVLFVIGPAK